MDTGNPPKSARFKKNYLSYGAQRSGNSNRMDMCFSEKQDHSMKISEKKDEVCKSIRSV